MTTTESPRHGLLIANVVAQLAFGVLAMTICIPSMQQWGAIFGASQSSVQLTFSGYVAAYGTMQLFYGPLSDRLGRKRMLLSGLTLALLGSVLAALAPDVGTLAAARVLQGAGCAAGMAVGRAMVQDLFQGPERTRVMAYVGMVMGLCPPLGTIVGGQLHVLFGWQANFVLTAAIAAGLWVAARRALPDVRPATPPSSHWLRAMASAYLQLAREREFVLYVVILAMSTASFYVFLAGTPTVLGGYGVGPERIGFYVMFVPVSYIVGNYITTHTAHRASAHTMMALGHALALAGIVIVLVLALAGVHTPLALAVPLMLLGAGHGLLVPPALTGTVGLIPALAGAAAAAAGVTQQLMGAVGGYAVGWLPQDGAAGLAALMLLFTAGGTAALVVLRRHARRARMGVAR